MSPPSLSQRAQERLENDLYTRYMIPSTRKFYDATHDPDGVINLATAENGLMCDELLKYMNGHCDLTRNHLKYRASLLKSRTPSLLCALPLYINAYADPVTPVTPEQLVIGPGLGAIFAHFVWTVCDEGDGVLLTTPFYDEYKRDIIYPSRANLVLAHIPASVDPLSLECIPFIRQTIRESLENKTKIRVLLLCNPHNPLGRAYPEETVLAYAEVAEEFNLHLLVDEAFANQTFPSSFCPSPTPFTSILSLHLEDTSRVHVLTGPTKTFGASATKVGALVSQANPTMVGMLNAALRATPVSSAADGLITKVLCGEMEDDLGKGEGKGASEELGTGLGGFARWFLEENRRRLSVAFELVGAWCVFHKIDFVPPSSGVFFIVDFDSIMPKYGYDDSGTLLSLSNKERLDNAVAAMLEQGVFIRPTNTYADPIPTRFRMTFTLPEKEMKLALRRIEKAFGLAEWPHFTFP